jgi:hypothetical protein
MKKTYKTLNNFTFEVLNNKTKKASDLLSRFNCSVGAFGLRSLLDCYDKPSEAKRKAYNKILKFCEQVGGYSAIIGFNSCAFSMGVYVSKTKTLYYFTLENSYIIKE